MSNSALAVRIAEAVMADLDCADVFGHRDELTASMSRHIDALADQVRAMHDYRPSPSTSNPERCSYHSCDDTDDAHVMRSTIVALLSDGE